MGIENKLNTIIKNKSEYLFSHKISLMDIKIEQGVLLKCFHCKNYKKKWTCPPSIPNISYMKLFSEYENSMLVYCKLPFESKEEFDVVRQESTNLLHKTLLDLEKELYLNNKSTAMSFIGGSCKLCKDGCAIESCRFPQMSRIPLEATGVNVIKLVKESIGIDVIFPPTKFLYRFGLLLW